MGSVTGTGTLVSDRKWASEQDKARLGNKLGHNAALMGHCSGVDLLAVLS
jgi:hypothetical protein